MEVLLLLVMGLSNIACFLIGVSVRQKVDKGEEIKLDMPKFDYTKQEARKQAELEKSRIDTILRNIDNYDGSSWGQEDVP